MRNFLLIPILLFSITAYANSSTSDSGLQSTSDTTMSQNSPKLASVTVKGLTFSVTSLRVASPQNFGQAEIWVNINNNGDEPIALNFDFNHANNILVNEYGVSWFGIANYSSGIGVMQNNIASTDFVISPGGNITAVLASRASDTSVTNYGNSFNFQGEFVSYKDRGDGHLIQTGVYPVSLIGIHPTSFTTNATQDIEGAKHKITNMFHQFFGN